MNIKDALEWTKANPGRCVMSDSSASWIKWYNKDFVYKLTFEELTADDWEPLGGVERERLGNG